VTRSLCVAALAFMFASGFLGSCGRRTVVEYRTVEVVREVYVPVEPELTNPHAIAEGELAACPFVAAARKAALEACNADKAEIRAQQGTVVTPKPVKRP